MKTFKDALKKALNQNSRAAISVLSIIACCLPEIACSNSSDLCVLQNCEQDDLCGADFLPEGQAVTVLNESSIQPHGWGAPFDIAVIRNAEARNDVIDAFRAQSVELPQVILDADLEQQEIIINAYRGCFNGLVDLSDGRRALVLGSDVGFPGGTFLIPSVMVLIVPRSDSEIVVLSANNDNGSLEFIEIASTETDG